MCNQLCKSEGNSGEKKIQAGIPAVHPDGRTSGKQPRRLEVQAGSVEVPAEKQLRRLLGTLGAKIFSPGGPERRPRGSLSKIRPKLLFEKIE